MTDVVDECLVLCIEDVESSALLVERALRRIPGVRVVMARNGHDALELVASTRCAVVLTDLNLPDVSGAEWVAELVGTVGSAGTPVVVVSADATPARKEAALAAGATGYLTKPIDLRQLISVVGELAGAPGGSGANPRSEPAGPPRALVERFLAEAAAELDLLRQAAAAGEPGPIGALAHRLKGSSAVFGAADLAAVLDRLEVGAREGHLDDAAALLDQADAAFAAFRDTV
jgi:CheY-like chemotaxis protein